MNHYEFVDGELVITTTNHCDEAQVFRTAGKPEPVFQKILHSFCESQDPSTVIEDEWHGADDERRAELESQHGWLPTLRGEAGGERPVFDVEAFKAQWLLDNYAELRKSAYGDWQEQMGMQYDGTWTDHVAAVKTRFSKP